MANFDIKDFVGVIPAMVTVFDKDENFDEQGQRDLVNYLIEQDVDGLYITGSTGEGFLMNPEERKRVVEVVMDEVAGRVPVVVHVGDIGTKISIDLAKHAQDKGATGISSVPPFYWRFNEEQIVSYYEDLSNAVEIPMIVYNVPLANLLGMSTIKRLATLKNVAGIKYTALAHFEIMQIKDEIGQDFLVYSGADEMALSGLLSGADGIIGSFYNMIPEVFTKINNAFREGDIAKATDIQKDAVRIIMYSLQYPSFYALMKATLRWNGINAGYCRKPFTNLTPEEEEKAKEGFKELKAQYNIEGVSFLDKL